MTAGNEISCQCVCDWGWFLSGFLHCVCKPRSRGVDTHLHKHTHRYFHIKHTRHLQALRWSSNTGKQDSVNWPVLFTFSQLMDGSDSKMWFRFHLHIGLDFKNGEIMEMHVIFMFSLIYFRKINFGFVCGQYRSEKKFWCFVLSRTEQTRTEHTKRTHKPAKTRQESRQYENFFFSLLLKNYTNNNLLLIIFKQKYIHIHIYIHTVSITGIILCTYTNHSCISHQNISSSALSHFIGSLTVSALIDFWVKVTIW